MKTNIPSPHDKYFRRSMDYPQVAHDFFETHLPEKIKRIADLKTLQLRKESYLDQELKESLTDILFSVNLDNKSSYLYILVEHQSTVDKLMAFRLLKYQILIMEQHLKESKDKRLPLIYPLVFYTGSKKYNASTDLFDLFAESHELARETFLKPFHLVDISQMSDENLKIRVWSGVMALCLKHIYERDILSFIHRDMTVLLKNVMNKGGLDFVEDTIRYIIYAADTSDLESFVEMIRENLSPQLGEKAMTLLESARQSGHKEGLQAGIMLGHQEGHQKGHQEGVMKSLQQLLLGKFGELPNQYLKLIQQADVDKLLSFMSRVLTAKNLAEIFE
jgi:predicted transposase/invertase (TIGR01784 family)